MPMKKNACSTINDSSLHAHTRKKLKTKSVEIFWGNVQERLRILTMRTLVLTTDCAYEEYIPIPFFGQNKVLYSKMRLLVLLCVPFRLSLIP